MMVRDKNKGEIILFHQIHLDECKSLMKDQEKVYTPV